MTESPTVSGQAANHGRSTDAPGVGRRTFLGAAGAAAAAAMLSQSGAAGASTPIGAAAPVSDRARHRRVRFGVNYVPSKNWWFSWADWDRRSVDADLRDIASLGMDHIRIMLLWSELQPNSTYVRERATRPIGRTARSGRRP